MKTLQLESILFLNLDKRKYKNNKSLIIYIKVCILYVD